MTATTGRIGAGQFDQLLFDVPLDLDLVRPRRLRPVIDGRFDSFGDEPLSDTSDGSRADTDGRHDVLVGGVSTGCRIRQQEDAGMCQFPACGFPFGDQLLQRGAFLRFECNTVLVHHGAPSLEAVLHDRHPQEHRARIYPSIEV